MSNGKDEVPQFLTKADEIPPFDRSNRAIYRLGVDQDGKPIEIAVEVVEGGGNIPRNATSLRSVSKDLTANLENELKAVERIARTALDALTSLRPGEVEIEFGIELGGELGIPLVTKGEAKANFKITLKWKKVDSGDP